MNKCYLYYTSLCVLLYFSASVVFYSVYRNIQGGIWSGFAALIAAQCCVLHALYFSNKLQLYYRQKTLNRLNVISFVIVLLASTFLIWYIFAMVYWKIPILEYQRTLLFPLVFTFISGKLGYHLYQATKEYSEYLASNYSPISDDFHQTV